VAPRVEDAFAEVVTLIQSARHRALQAVNTELVGLYWQVGEYISRKLASAEWGDGVVDELARHLEQTQPGLRGFTRRNLFRMRQFYETYRDDQKVSPLVTQLPWTHNLLILSQSKRAEEREFYLRMAIRERWGKRELERQFRAALFERAVLNPPKMSALLTHMHPAATEAFKDAYVVDFLQLPAPHSESDLHRGLLTQLKAFLIELGRDFCFVGSEYPVQVGERDFALDLLFFHRGLNCRARAPRQAQLLPRSPRPQRPQAAREPGHRSSAVREQGRGGRRVRPQPLAFAGADREVTDATPREAVAAGQAARVLSNARSTG